MVFNTGFQEQSPNHQFYSLPIIRYFSGVFYKLLKIYARLTIHLYCPRIIINRPEVATWEGPLLLAANHPNSFLDGIILTTLLDNKLYSLARGDAFKKKWLNRFLRSIHLLPVYRTSEGVENLEHNYTTFRACIDAFKKGHIVLIFSEGRCENEWHLRPLKKGTARLASSAWQNNIDLTVLPVAFNYSSFKKFGKELHLHFGRPISYNDIDQTIPEGKQNLQFNNLLQEQLQSMVYEIDDNDNEKIDATFARRKDLRFYLLLIPGLIGYILHLPLLAFCTFIAKRRFSTSGHYDSVQTSLFLISYPFYMVALSIVTFTINPVLGFITPVVLYLTAWASAQIKYVLNL
jgi:1-acyl-sn-glycerol-3-phosphate acyltransferase